MIDRAIVNLLLNHIYQCRQRALAHEMHESDVMFRTMFAAAALMALSPLAQAGAEPVNSAEALVTVAAVEITASDRAHVADAVLQSMDVAAIARFTLGRHGKSLDAEAKTRFAEAFEVYLRRQILANADQLAGAQVTVTKTLERNARDAVVTTRIEQSGELLTLRWRVIERGGKWAVVDLEFAGIWLAIEQRAQVSAILDRPGADIETVIAQFQ